MTQTDVSMELIAENIRQMSSRASAIAESAGNQTSATNVITDADARAAAGSQQASHTADKIAQDAQKANALAAEISTVVTRSGPISVALVSTRHEFLARFRQG